MRFVDLLESDNYEDEVIIEAYRNLLLIKSGQLDEGLTDSSIKTLKKLLSWIKTNVSSKTRVAAQKKIKQHIANNDLDFLDAFTKSEHTKLKDGGNPKPVKLSSASIDDWMGFLDVHPPLTDTEKKKKGDEILAKLNPKEMEVFWRLQDADMQGGDESGLTPEETNIVHSMDTPDDNWLKHLYKTFKQYNKIRFEGKKEKFEKYLND